MEVVPVVVPSIRPLPPAAIKEQEVQENYPENVWTCSSSGHRPPHS